MQAAKNIKLTYFDIYGLGEIPRILLTHAGKQFEDFRVSEEEWPSIRPSTPFGVMPILEVDGERYVESIPIWNYLAREFGWYPTDHKEQMTTEVIVSLYREIFNIQVKWYYLEDGPDKEALGVKARQDSVIYLKYLDKMLEETGTGYFIGNKVTFADLVMLDCITGYNKNSITFTPELYPNIAKNNANVLKDPKIKSYFDSRPFCQS